MRATLIILILLLFCAPLQAGDYNGSVTIAGGISAPLRPSTIADDYDIGPNLGLGLCYHPLRILEIEPRIIFSSFPHKDHESFKIFELGSDFKFYTQEKRPERPSVYFVIGLGMTYMSYSNGEELWGEAFDRESKTGTESVPGISLGLGVGLQLVPGFGVFTDVRYAVDYGEYDVVNYLSLRLGLLFSSKRQAEHDNY